MVAENVASNSGSPRENVYLSAASQMPEAFGDFAKEAWSHPLSTGLNLGKEGIESAAIGAGLAYVLPAGGPAGWAIGAAFTIPLLVKGGEALWDAHKDASKPGANVNEVGRKLADDTVTGAVNLGVTFGAGWAGAEAGYKLGDSDTAAGRFSQGIRTKLSDFENKGIVAATKGWNVLTTDLGTRGATTGGAPAAAAGDGAGMAPRTASSLPTDGSALPADVTATHTSGTSLNVMKGMSFTTRALTQLENRIGQATQTSDGLNGLTEYPALIHGHTALSDGDATPQSFVDRAKAAGYKVVLPSEHDHVNARMGVEPGDERTDAEKNTPIVGSDPQEEQTARDVAAAASTPGQFFADWGEELGVIGRLPPKLNPDGTQVPRGANHTGLYGAEPYVRSGEAPPPTPTPVANAIKSVRSALGFKAAETPISIEDIPDGQYEQLAAYLDSHPNPNNKVVAIFNHPREAQDWSANTPANQQGHDYGMSRWPNMQSWLTNWGDKYGRAVEIMKGGALTQDPIAVIPPNYYDTTSAQMLWDKGAHVGVSAGPDIHYQTRIGQPPLATTILAKSLDREGVYDALDARRMAVTSNFNKLSAYLTANDGKFMMGNILDQGAVGTQGLTPEVHIGGNIAPDADYTVNIWSDPQTGDGQLAGIVQTKTINGADLAKANNTVTFDAVPHQAGNHSLLYAEVQRTDSTSPTYGDIMHTNERNADGTPANVTMTPRGMFVKGLTEQYEEDGSVYTRDYADTPATIDIQVAANMDPSTKYPERAITSPIFVDPISGVKATHSTYLRGIGGANFQSSDNQVQN